MKIHFEIEVVLPVSQKLLYKFISTEEGLAKWFADKVLINKENNIEFYWSKSKHEASILSQKEPKYFKFSWIEDLEAKNDAYIEFCIIPSSEDNLVTLKITDFSEEEEKDDSLLLWESTIEKLKRSLGVLRD